MLLDTYLFNLQRHTARRHDRICNTAYCAYVAQEVRTGRRLGKKLHREALRVESQMAMALRLGLFTVPRCKR